MRGLSLVAASGGHSSSRGAGLSPSRPLLLRSIGSRRAGSATVAHGPSCSAACGIFPDQGSNPCPLHWQADSQPLLSLLLMKCPRFSLSFSSLTTHIFLIIYSDLMTVIDIYIFLSFKLSSLTGIILLFPEGKGRISEEDITFGGTAQVVSQRRRERVRKFI